MSSARRRENRVLHNRLRTMRAENGLSRTELADLIGVNVQTVGALERGQYYPSLYVAMLISEALAMPVQDIFAWVPWASAPPREGD